jgi:hypothetical protein
MYTESQPVMCQVSSRKLSNGICEGIVKEQEVGTEQKAYQLANPGGRSSWYNSGACMDQMVHPESGLIPTNSTAPCKKEILYAYSIPCSYPYRREKHSRKLPYTRRNADVVVPNSANVAVHWVTRSFDGLSPVSSKSHAPCTIDACSQAASLLQIHRPTSKVFQRATFHFIIPPESRMIYPES